MFQLLKRDMLSALIKGITQKSKDKKKNKNKKRIKMRLKIKLKTGTFICS